MGKGCGVSARRLSPEDEALAVEVVNRFKGRHVCPSHVREFLAQPKHYLFVAEDDKGPVGFLQAYHLTRLDGQPGMLFLYEIEVDERHRRLGIGSKLVSMALEYVRSNGWKEAFVFTNHSNPVAVEFYESVGGRIENGDDLLLVFDP